jgi:hypothetical protein
MIAISTVRDEAAAQVAREALAAVGIPVELKRLGANPYFGSVTGAEWEIRVPEEREGEALAELDRIAADVEQAVLAEAGVPAGEDDDDLHADEPQPKKVSWALVLSLLLPFPGGGCMYARANAVGWLLCGVLVGLLLCAVAGVRFEHSMQLWMGAKLLDLALAPIFVVRFNHRLKREPDATRS